MARGIQATPLFDVTPPPSVKPTSSNYLSVEDFTQIYDSERLPSAIDRYAGQENLLTNLTEALGAVETTSSSDLLRWSELGRIRPVIKAGVGKVTSVTLTTKNLTVTGGHPFRVGEVIQLKGAVTASAVEATNLARVSSITSSTVVALQTIEGSAFTVDNTGTKELTVTVVSSEFLKGSDAMSGSLKQNFDTYTNKMKILKDHYEENYSDFSSVSWMSVNGNYFWTNYEMEATRKRFAITKELDALQSVLADSSSDAYSANLLGMQGVFAAIKERGNDFQGYVSSKTDLESMIKRLDKTAGSPVMMMLQNREADLAADNFFAQLSPNAGGINSSEALITADNYGSFANGSKTMLDLGFKGVKWGSYEWYKQAWAAFTVPTSTLAPDNIAAADQVNGIIMPYGKTPVKVDGETMKVPYFSMIYKAGNNENRKLKTTVRGFEQDGGDKIKIEYLSEYTTRLACANRFFIETGSNV